MEKGDFVEIEYTGRVKSSGEVFDTTDEEVAKKAGIYSEHTSYGPITVVVGAGHVINGLDEALLTMKEGDKKVIELPPEKAFGKRNQKLVRVFSLTMFRKKGITPRVGEVIYFNNVEGRVVGVSSGRVVVDFNHPLAGKSVEYQLKIIRKVTDPAEKVKAIFKYHTLMPDDGFDVKIEDKKATITVKMIIAEQIADRIKEEITKYVKEVESVEIIMGGEKEKKGENKETRADGRSAEMREDSESKDDEKSKNEKEQPKT